MVLAKDDLYKLWVDVCKAWLSGSLPGANGKISRTARPDSQITSNICCPFEGMKDLEGIKNILTMIKLGKALLKKDKTSIVTTESLEELAETTKQIKFMRERILGYL